MDIFPRPDIAEGIFYEYLRTDDPMSKDFLERVVDGFPFILAPLAQVKGVSMPSSLSEERHGDRGIFKAVGGIAGSLSIQAETLGGWLHDSASAFASKAFSTVQFAGETARGITEEMDRRRDVLVRQLVSIPESSLHFVASRFQPNRRGLSTIPSWLRSLGGKESVIGEGPRRPGAPRGRVFRSSPLSRWLGESHDALPDEIGPMIHPTMTLPRKVFLAMVHLYLLLLLIVSLPGTPNTRSRLVVRRKRRLTEWMDGAKTTKDALLSGPGPPRGGNRTQKSSDDCSKGKIKKSLSYFL